MNMMGKRWTINFIWCIDQHGLLFKKDVIHNFVAPTSTSTSIATSSRRDTRTCSIPYSGTVFLLIFIVSTLMTLWRENLKFGRSMRQSCHRRPCITVSTFPKKCSPNMALVCFYIWIPIPYLSTLDSANCFRRPLLTQWHQVFGASPSAR